MLCERVTSDDIARVIVRSTDISVQSLLQGERERLVHARDLSACLAGNERCW